MPYEEDKLQGIDGGTKPERFGGHAAGQEAGKVGGGGAVAGGRSGPSSARGAAVRPALPRQRHLDGSA